MDQRRGNRILVVNAAWSRSGGLPIIEVRRGVRCLVDTGSTHTIISRGALERLRGKKGTLQVCHCKLVTLGGRCQVEGETVVSLDTWAASRGTIKVHVVENMPRGYQAIIGCDLLERVGAKIHNRKGEWSLRIGGRLYQTRDLRGFSGAHVGVVATKDWREEVKREYQDIFFREGEVLGVTGRTVHEIPLKEDRVCYVKERRYPQALREHIRGELQNLQKQGIIVASTSPFSSPLWAVKKKNTPGEKGERYRVVVDYRKLNELTVDEKYPLPRFEDILDRMSGATVFSTLDLKAGYHQIRLHPRDQHKTAFTFERGHWEFTRMPFGLKNAPLTFQRLMDEFLRGIDESMCQVYMDDLIVFSRTEREHARHLREVFNRVRQFGLKLSGEKTILGKEKINFLGHSVSKEGVRPDAGKVEAISRMAIPTDIKGIRRLLGTLNYYRRFVPDMAQLLVPLNNLLKKGQKIVITPVIEDNIRRCLRRLQEQPILAFPDFSKPFTVTTDASEYALGAVLSQEGSDGGERPVAYASRRLSDPEARYSALERELLGIVWAIEHFRPYVFGRKFKVVTDHRPLQWVGKLKESSARVTRWKEFLSQYNMEVVYKPGRENVVADWLSRAITVNAMEQEGAGPSGDSRGLFREVSPEDKDNHAGSDEDGESTAEDSPPGDRATVMDEIDEIINDKRCQIIWKSRMGGSVKVDYASYGRCKITTIWSQPGVKADQICRALNDVSRPGGTYHLYVGNTVIWDKVNRLWREERIGVDRKFVRCTRMVETLQEKERQREVTQAYHQGKTNHRGIVETLQALQRRYFWWGMKRVVAEVIGNCDVCLTAKYDRHPPRALQEETPTASEPLVELQVDTFTWRGFKWVTLLDLFSKIAMAFPVRDRSARAVLMALQQWFQVYGVPDRISSDGGREFDNATLREEIKDLGVVWHVNTPGHPKSRGGIERLHSTLSEHLRVYHIDRGLEPDQAMPRAVAAYNHSVHSATGFTPFEVLFGLRARPRDPTGTLVDEEVTRTVLNNRVELVKRWQSIRERLVGEKRRRVARENAKLRDGSRHDLRIGAVVYRRVGSNRGKELRRYEGPFKIVVIREHNIVTIESLAEPRKRRTVHLEQLKFPLVEHNSVAAGVSSVHHPV